MPSRLLRFRPAKYFARMFITSTNAISTSAAAQAAAWSSGDGDSERVKIRTGSVASALWTSTEIWFCVNDEVKSSGAVSPATRATAITTPVRMPPIAVGRTMLYTVRQRGTPRARLASRRWRGHELEHLLRRARDHRDHQDREGHRAVDRALAVADDEQAVDEDADDDRRDAVEDVQHDAEERRGLRAGVLGDVDRDEDRDRNGHDRSPCPTIRALPTRASAMPPCLAEERGRLGEEAEADLADPLEEDGAEHEREDRDRKEGAQDRKHARRASRIRRRRPRLFERDGDVVRIGDLGGAHPVDILRAFWNLFTITWAETFVTSEITIRIAPR